MYCQYYRSFSEIFIFFFFFFFNDTATTEIYTAQYTLSLHDALPNYHVPNRPFFDQLELKGGGDAVSAARAVIQTGEYDFAWNLQVEDDILKRMEQGGKGRVDIAVAGNTEHINVNQTDPWTEVDGERSS